MNHSNNSEEIDTNGISENEEANSVVTDYVSAFDRDLEKKKNERETKSIASSVYEWIETIVFAGCFVLFVFAFVARPARVVGGSMLNTLTEGDTVIVSDLFYKPEYGDVVVFQNIEANRSDPLIKRVIATEGQWVNIEFHSSTRTMSVYVADSESELATAEPLDESMYAIYLQDAFVMSGINFPVCVPEDHIFVLGDNRNHSLDSRSMDVGFVNEQNIVGKVLFRAIPLNKFGALYTP